MKCEQVRRWLSESTPGNTKGWQAWFVRRHLAHCPECAQTAHRVHQLEEAVQTWRNEAPAGDLQVRIRANLRTADTQQFRRAPLPLSRGLRTAFATILILVCIGLFGLRSNSSATALQRMQAAILAIRNAHVTTWTNEYQADNHTVTHRTTELQKVEEMWYQAGKWRKEGVWGSRIIVSGSDAGESTPTSPVYGTYYRYDANAKKVVAMRETGKQWSEFTVEAITGMDNSHTAYRTTDIHAATDQPGQTSFLVEKSSTGNRYRFLCRVDSRTNLPITIDVQNREQGDWNTTTRFEFQFNQEFPKSLFEPATLKHENWALPARK